MELSSICAISAFVGSLAYFALAFFMYFKVSQRTREVKLFLLLCLDWSIYNIALMLQFIIFHKSIASERVVLVCMNISNTLGAFLFIIYVDFLLTFANRRPKWYWGVYGVQVVIAPIFIFHEWTSELLKGKAHFYPPPFIIAPRLAMFFLILVVWGLVSLRLACRDTDSPIRRKMLRFLFWASFLTFPAAASDMAFMLRNRGFFPFSTLVGLGYAVYFSYAIVKYRFLGVRIAARKSIIYVLLTVPITTFFFVAAVISYNFTFGVKIANFSPLIVLWASIAAIAFYLIRERLEIFIDRVMFKKSYQYQRSLEQLEHDIINEVDPGSFTSRLAGWLETSLRLEHVDIFLLETDIGKEKQYFTTIGTDEKTETKKISGDSLLVKCLEENQETLFRADLPILPQFRELYQDLDREFQDLLAEVCVPLATDRLLFSVDPDFQNDLNSNDISEELRGVFDENRMSLSHSASVLLKEKGRKWEIADESNAQIYIIRREADKLNIYTGSKLRAIIVCGNKKRGKFEEEDRRLLGIAAYTIAFAVERTQLILELKSASQFKWDLVRWLSHDLNTPLTPIKMIVNALRTKIGDNEEDQQAISVVTGEITRLQSLISGLDFIADLDVKSKHHYGKNELMDMGSLIAEVVTLFEWQAKENGISLFCKVSPNISPLRGNADRMKQALTNLISNSIKYNRPGGKVEVAVTQTNNNIIASIVDTGVGISRLEETSIFEPFYRGDKAQAMGKGGVGLGLAIVKKIVEEHGGAIQLQSESDVGTSINLTIPCDPQNDWNWESAVEV